MKEYLEKESPLHGEQKRPKTIVLGLGNSIVTDDSVGLRVVRAARDLLVEHPDVVVMENERGGMDVLDLIGPYQRAFLVDAIKTGQGSPGTLCLLSVHQVPPTRRLCGLHDLDLPTALALAERLNMQRPQEIVILAVEIEDDLNFGQRCTPRVAAAIEPAARVVAALVGGEQIPADVEIHTIEEVENV